MKGKKVWLTVALAAVLAALEAATGVGLLPPVVVTAAQVLAGTLGVPGVG